MRVTALVFTVALGAGALGLTIALLPGVSADDGRAVLVAAVTIGLLGAALRPALVRLLSAVGWIGVVGGWLLCQALLVYAVLLLTPGVHVDGFAAAFGAAWLGAGLTSTGLWVVTAGQDGVVTQHLLRVNRHFRSSVPHTDEPGLLIIQIDGLSAPLARWAIEAGNLPTLGRWLADGSHAMAEWYARLPATTPASQAGILHGASDQVPAFRWYEKDTGRMIVTNRPRDAALVETRCSDGHGLLAAGGVSVSNVFSGDAPTSLFTMSTARRARSGPRRYVSTYLLDPFGLTRSLILTCGEILKELHQARRQRLRRVRPRMRRVWSYVLLRGATNVLLRHLNLAVLAEHTMRGAPVVYCDFVDYDEIAHHAGPARPEALAALEGIDAALAILEEVAAAAPRPYRFVVLSDHGQSLGATFAQRYGTGFEELVAGLVRTGNEPPRATADPAEIVVAASGNLALIYFAQRKGRVTLEAIEESFPELIPGLAGHPGIGWVLVRSEREGPIVIGRDGRRWLDDDHVEGVDPLLDFGPHAAGDLRRHDRLANTGDLVVNSLWDPVTQEVAAFEELIGCHGGLGGGQSRPVLIHPRDWAPPGELAGADEVYRYLRGCLGKLTPPG
ncbi:alkaline phosphatase family protein [Actinoplanes sp. L3-i22]|uniref:phage holin family protein n=1 Tax=Actinoplanes sp. L3-i22 TaxID=2836373 RepID=UPI001C75EE0E|nr:alkaline phosphatase family protein [Actinoplanes sp. L3-i22]BCY11370.1 membrane protein [Actinoplanes sp. L3-i22]